MTVHIPLECVMKLEEALLEQEPYLVWGFFSTSSQEDTWHRKAKGFSCCLTSPQLKSPSVPFEEGHKGPSDDQHRQERTFQSVGQVKDSEGVRQQAVERVSMEEQLAIHKSQVGLLTA